VCLLMLSLICRDSFMTLKLQAIESLFPRRKRKAIKHAVFINFVGVVKEFPFLVIWLKVKEMKI
jgi:hypothetical protein